MIISNILINENKIVLNKVATNGDTDTSMHNKYLPVLLVYIFSPVIASPTEDEV